MLVACLFFFCYKQHEDSPIIHEMVSIANKLNCDAYFIYINYFAIFTPTLTNMCIAIDT